MLNIHKIGVDAPVQYLFDEIMKWNGDARCWPNNVAHVKLMDEKLETIHVYLLKPLLVGKKRIGLRLFNLKILRIQHTPSIGDYDNSRYILYQCSGGYPIGIFSMFVRSSIRDMEEQELSQLFIVTSFNFYGSRNLSRIRFIRNIWGSVHNRVTANVANRFKELCEWRFRQFQKTE
jgi:hypothetical protein